MSLQIHLRDCHGDGRRLSARSAILKVADGSIGLGDSSYLSFKRGSLEIDLGKKLSVFGLGEGFASLENSAISLIAESVVESPPGLGDLCSGHLAPMDACRCVVCESLIKDEAYCQTINDRRINLCCPRCAETFVHAQHLVRKIDTAQTEETPGSI